MKGWGVWMLGLLLVLVQLAWGEVSLSWTEVWDGLRGTHPLAEAVLLQVRLPRVLAAASTGMLLASAGLVMQTWFRNPLAGPGVLGVTSGGSLGVAVGLLTGWAIPVWISAAAGCLLVLLGVAWAARRFASPVTTLVFGLMVSYAVGAVVTLLESRAEAEALQSFVFWGMGTFGRAALWQAGLLVALSCVIWGWLRRRSAWFDAWTLGPDLAQTMGVSRRVLEGETLLVVGLVVGWVTSVCGPIAFLGLATPHVYRFFHAPRAHRVMASGVAGWGIVLGLVSDGLVRWSEAAAWSHWPLNAVLAMMGAPVVIAVIWKRSHDMS
ncbi:MAG: hypothetical protein RLZZ314_688 [Bacteroidota bacterium]|jgi:iron complex transport system permease protein